MITRIAGDGQAEIFARQDHPDGQPAVEQIVKLRREAGHIRLPESGDATDRW